jgi:hypothetical protein
MFKPVRKIAVFDMGLPDNTSGEKEKRIENGDDISTNKAFFRIARHSSMDDTILG